MSDFFSSNKGKRKSYRNKQKLRWGVGVGSQVDCPGQGAKREKNTRSGKISDAEGGLNIPAKNLTDQPLFRG